MQKVVCLALLFFANSSLSEEGSYADLFELSLEELMNVEVYSASKKKEAVSRSPLSISVITHDAIRNSTATNLPELLKTLPGVIVREQTNGVFDVHIRGTDNVPPGGLYPSLANTLTLVMIDNEPFFNYFNGGTFWETLPITLDDLERVELIRGPAAALYGPNAVNGVIHFFTKSANKEMGGNLHANVGGYGNAKVNLNYSNNISKNESIRLSFAHQQRSRYQETYYGFSAKEYLPADQIKSTLSGTMADRNPNPDVAEKTTSGTIKIQNSKEADWHHNISLMFVDTEVQKIFSDTAISTFTTNITQLSALNINIENANWFFHSGFQKADHKALGTFVDYSFENKNLIADYIINEDNFNWRNGISLHEQTYTGDFISGKQSIRNLAASTRLDWKIDEAWRLISALRIDNYSTPNTTNLSYQFALNKLFSNESLFRLVHAKAYRSPFIEENFFYSELNFSSGTKFKTVGNTHLEMVSATNTEIGYRFTTMSDVGIEFEAFYIDTSGFNNLYLDSIDGNVITYNYQNTPTESKQYGSTVSVQYQPGHDFSVTAYISWQKTKIYSFSGPTYQKQELLTNLKHQGTPRWYGGVNLHGKFEAIQWDVLFYTMKSHTQIRAVNSDKIPSIFLLDLKLSYPLASNIDTYLSLKNIGTSSREFSYADKIEPYGLIGMQLTF
jgi:iron complex outermembrane receptor protein